MGERRPGRNCSLQPDRLPKLICEATLGRKEESDLRELRTLTLAQPEIVLAQPKAFSRGARASPGSQRSRHVAWLSHRRVSSFEQTVINISC